MTEMLCIVVLTVLLSPSCAGSTEQRFWNLLEKLDKYEELEEVSAEHGIAELKQTFLKNIVEEGEDDGEEMDSAINLMSKSDYENTLTLDVSESEPAFEEPYLRSEMPESLDWRLAQPSIIAPVINQGPCGSCGTISGTRAAESRMAIASGTYRHYSVQQMMNCGPRRKICRGTFSPAIWQQMRVSGRVVDDSDMPYLNSARKCGKDYENCQCDIEDKENVWDDQSAFLGLTTKLGQSEQSMIQALQSGPVTICYTAQKGQNARNVTQCGDGRTCNHANNVVGYDKDFFFVQNTYGQGWGPLGGYWNLNRKSECWSKMAWKYARFPAVWEDNSKTGATFSEGKLEYAVTLATTTAYNLATLGRAKKTCGLMGDQCVAIVQREGGEYELVSSMTPSAVPLPGYRALYTKTQLIVLLYHEGTKQYLAVQGDTLMLSGQGTPFFLANGQFRAYHTPRLHLVTGPRLASVSDSTAQWGLRNCNLHNVQSGASLSLTKGKRYSVKAGTSYDETNLLQRFNLGLSSTMLLESAQQKLRVFYRDNGLLAVSTKKNKGDCFVWNARQILSCRGQAVRPDMGRLDNEQHTASDTQNTVQPRDCSLLNLEDGRLLNVDNSLQLSMTSSLSPIGGGWTFRYQDL